MSNEHRSRQQREQAAGQEAGGVEVHGSGTTEAELVAELLRLRQRIAELEAGEGRRGTAVRRTAEERFRTLYETIPLMYFTLDSDGTVLEVNAYGAEHLGYRPAELIGEPVLKVFHPEDRRAVAERLRVALADPGRVARWRFRKIRKDATTLWVSEAVRVVEEDGRAIVQVVCEDITEKVASEEKLEQYQDELRALASEATLAEARERRRIAEGLHDQTGQTLVAARMQLRVLRAVEADVEKGRSLGEIDELVHRALQQTRSLTFELSCPVLYRLGLTAALSDLGEELEQESGLRFHFAADPDLPPIAEDHQVLLFRCARELFHNAVKHARATSIRVSLRRAGDGLRIAVEDDGTGFDGSKPRSGHAAAGGLGLFAIRERLRHLGGRLEIETAAGAGTVAWITLPLSPPPEQGETPS